MRIPQLRYQNYQQQHPIHRCNYYTLSTRAHNHLLIAHRTRLHIYALHSIAIIFSTPPYTHALPRSLFPSHSESERGRCSESSTRARASSPARRDSITTVSRDDIAVGSGSSKFLPLTLACAQGKLWLRLLLRRTAALSSIRKLARFACARSSLRSLYISRSLCAYTHSLPLLSLSPAEVCVCVYARTRGAPRAQSCVVQVAKGIKFHSDIIRCLIRIQCPGVVVVVVFFSI